MEVMKERPPYVSFEVQAVEDRQASIEAGHYVAKDVVYAIVTPAGSKDRIPRVASEWLAMLAEQVQQQRFPGEWLNAFREAYKAFCEGREAPLNGTALRDWPVISPAQLQQLLNFSVRTVEDLAVANEETLSRLGMGGRALKQKAIEWLDASKGIGAQAEMITAIKLENAQLKETVNAQAAAIAELRAKVEGLVPKKG